jgi:hypothetical protein
MSSLLSVAHVHGEALMDIFFLDARGVLMSVYLIPVEYMYKSVHGATLLDEAVSSER